MKKDKLAKKLAGSYNLESTDAIEHDASGVNNLDRDEVARRISEAIGSRLKKSKEEKPVDYDFKEKYK